MKRHELKTWPQPFAAVRRGLKRHEVRRADRDYQPGDVVVLREWDPSTASYTGEVITGSIGHVTRGGEWGIPSDLCVFSMLCVLHKETPPCGGHRCHRAEADGGRYTGDTWVHERESYGTCSTNRARLDLGVKEALTGKPA